MSTYNRLKVHVSASEVVRRARAKVATHHRRSREVRTARHQLYREMIAAHHRWQDMCRHWRM